MGLCAMQYGTSVLQPVYMAFFFQLHYFFALVIFTNTLFCECSCVRNLDFSSHAFILSQTTYWPKCWSDTLIFIAQALVIGQGNNMMFASIPLLMCLTPIFA